MVQAPSWMTIGPGVTTPLASALAVVVSTWLRTPADLTSTAAQTSIEVLCELEGGERRRFHVALAFGAGVAISLFVFLVACCCRRCVCGNVVEARRVKRQTSRKV